jgi:hypothetical protein
LKTGSSLSRRKDKTVQTLGLTLWSLAFLLIQSVSAAQAAGQQADCLIDTGPCSKSAGAQKVVFDISPKPVRAMKELTFTVRLDGGNIPPSLVLNLSMPGMYMGRNEVTLKKTRDGGYSGRGVIPRCPSGKKLWQAEIDIPGAGRVAYRFDVAY